MNIQLKPGLSWKSNQGLAGNYEAKKNGFTFCGMYTLKATSFLVQTRY